MPDNYDLLNELESGVNLSEVDTDFPALAICDVACHVDKIETAENSKKTGHNLIIVFKTAEERVSTKDQPVPAGYQITNWISLVQTEKYDPRQNLANFQDAVLGTAQGSRPSFFPLEQYQGAEVNLRVKPEIDDNGVMRTRIVRFIKRG